jgi:uncharacterized protein (TIGR02145 family)
MKAQTIMIAAALTACLADGCNGPTQEGGPAPGASLDGSTTYAGTKIPVAGVRVECQGRHDSSGADGRFSIPDLFTGAATMSAAKAGFDPYLKEIDIPAGGLTIAVPLTTPLFTHTLTGTVTSAETDLPVPGAAAVLLNDDRTPSNLTATTDSSGFYGIGGVPEGERRIRFTNPVFDTLTATVDVGGSGPVLNVKLSPGCPSAVEYGARSYRVVRRGSRCWMRENLDIGTMVAGVSQSDNGLVEKYCYNNDTANCGAYGGLYQWDEAMEYSNGEGARGICPDGWRLPTLQEYDDLAHAPGVDGNALKEVGQGSGTGAGTNTTGFSALLAGGGGGASPFGGLGSYGYFLSSSRQDSATVWSMALRSSDFTVVLASVNKSIGMSVRCIME